jgi:hypothetical protein
VDARPSIARAVWGLVPDTLQGRADPPPELIRGSAVAVADGTLLASCDAVGDRQAVGIVRRSRYRVARIGARVPGQRVCALHPPEPELQTARAWRSFDDLQLGEPILAVTSRTSRSFALASGRLAAKGAADDPYLETTIVLPAGTLSTALFDAYGDLIGFGSAGPASDSVLLAAPLQGVEAAGLAQVRLGTSPEVLASLASAPRAQPASPPTLVTPVPLPPDDTRQGIASTVTGSSAATGATPPPPRVAPPLPDGAAPQPASPLPGMY